jgi:hypothetical protein
VVAVGDGVHVEHHPDALGLLVDPAEEVEEVAVELGVVADQLGRPPPVALGDRRRQQPVGDLRRDRVTQLRDQVVA